jgi:phosphoribosylformylglycinamidine cyclo-ligase
VKDNLFPVPAIFDAIQAASQSSDEEMYQVFNMGHRLEVYAPDNIARDVIDIAASYGIAAQVIGYTEPNPHNKLSLRNPAGRTIVYE